MHVKASTSLVPGELVRCTVVEADGYDLVAVPTADLDLRFLSRGWVRSLVVVLVLVIKVVFIGKAGLGAVGKPRGDGIKLCRGVAAQDVGANCFARDQVGVAGIRVDGVMRKDRPSSGGTNRGGVVRRTGQIPPTASNAAIGGSSPTPWHVMHP